ncbi:hypothetical protein EVAR_94986_1 [Eumeta japonica]|uniref:Uncharacterized protein n=1 Tax=Eumeta variegata TaxID=151549 RepID=A0A4C1UUI8_EUMVA|nr:hypothetical protein EVAR_94986_1 [Eumeta japonica]
MVTAAHGHSQPQMNHQGIAGLSGGNRISNGREIELVKGDERRRGMVIMEINFKPLELGFELHYNHRKPTKNVTHLLHLFTEWA